MKGIITTSLFLILLSTSIIAQYDDPTMNKKIDRQINDRLFFDDVIITSSLGIGMDMYSGYSFGFDTFVLREDNLRILFDDQSNSSSFPRNDWRISINDFADHGDNYFRIEDVSAQTVPFTIEASVPSDALFVKEYSGNVGLGTNTPQVKLHLSNQNSPTMRLEQNYSGGWTPQTWDVGGNESNFFINDVTNFGNAPFRIGARTPTNTLTLKESGFVGVGTWTPEHTLEVKGDVQVDSHFYFGDESTDGNWRVNVINGVLTFEKRESGVWVTKLELE